MAVEDAGGADDVGLVGADGVVVGVADERLGGDVEDDFGGEVDWMAGSRAAGLRMSPRMSSTTEPMRAAVKRLGSVQGSSA